MKLLTKPTSPKQRIEAAYSDLMVSQGMPAGTAFSIALPRGWVKIAPEYVQLPGPDNPVVSLAHFRPSQEGALGLELGTEVVVWAAFLPRELHGCDWLSTWITSQGYQRLDSREAPTPFGIMGDALALRVHNGTPRLHRLTTVKDADLIFLIDGRANFASGSDDEVSQEIFLMAIIRFRLLQATKQIFAEGFEPVVLSGRASVRFKASGLWKHRPGADAPTDGASLILDNVIDQTVVGSMIAVLGRPGQPVSEIETITLNKLVTLGITFIGRTQPEYDDSEPEWKVNVRSVSATRNGGSLTVTSARMTLGETPICLVLVSPPQSEAFEVWAVNRRAFGIALDSMEINAAR